MKSENTLDIETSTTNIKNITENPKKKRVDNRPSRRKKPNFGFCQYEPCGKTLEGLRVHAIYCNKICRRSALKRRKLIESGHVLIGMIDYCARCTSPFEKTGSQQVFCNKRCTRLALRERSRTMDKERDCKICGDKFEPQSSMHTMCSEKCIRINRRNISLAKNYKITEIDFLEIFEKQGKKCAICKITEEENVGKWALDHDHSCCQGYGSCGSCIRGILCTKCNQAIGLLKDSPSILESAIAYLQKGRLPSKSNVYIGGRKKNVLIKQDSCCGSEATE